MIICSRSFEKTINITSKMSVNYEKPSAEILKKIITNAQDPIVFKNILNWSILDWNLNDWNARLGDEELQFRCGQNKHTEKPQWENTTETVKGTFQYFLDYQKEHPDKWLYFDYKYLKDWLINVSELANNISWKDFGFSNLNYCDSTIWIGTKGAHTPCHIDTYGFNLIAQIYGKKQWFICPSDENLLPTRIPYEESSIYSKVNLFSPSSNQITVNNARIVTLNPGEVLFLPHGWWHYVENKETAISINVWLPHASDDEKRVEEAVVQFLIAEFVKNVNTEHQKFILNPSPENVELSKTPFINNIKLINKCAEKVKNSAKKPKLDFSLNKPDVDFKIDLQKFENYANVVPKISNSDLQLWLRHQRKDTDLEVKTAPKETYFELTRVIDAILQPDVIELIKNKLL